MVIDQAYVRNDRSAIDRAYASWNFDALCGATSGWTLAVIWGAPLGKIFIAHFGVFKFIFKTN